MFLNIELWNTLFTVFFLLFKKVILRTGTPAPNEKLFVCRVTKNFSNRLTSVFIFCCLCTEDLDEAITPVQCLARQPTELAFLDWAGRKV